MYVKLVEGFFCLFPVEVFFILISDIAGYGFMGFLVGFYMLSMLGVIMIEIQYAVSR